MNERIRELHRQVMSWADTPDCPDTVEWDKIPEEYTKKLALFIVRECMFAVENHGGMCGVTSSKKIKDHFGI